LVLPVDAKLAESLGRKARAGQLVRLLDVPAERGAGFGVFDNAGSDGDGGALAKSIKLAAISAYGTAGPEFVRRLIADSVTGDDVRGLISNFVTATISGAADGQVERAAQRFGLIAAAGELAASFGIVPWPEGAARAAAAWALTRWIEMRGGTGSAEARQAVETVRLFIEQHGDARFDRHRPFARVETMPASIPRKIVTFLPTQSDRRGDIMEASHSGAAGFSDDINEERLNKLLDLFWRRDRRRPKADRR
jgi:putative DNA primase/helicase